MRTKALISEANEVPISKACELIGMRIYSIERKIYCPFGNLYHSDGGVTPTMRIYPSNTIYCFNCMKSYSPVALVSLALDCPWSEAAVRILEFAGVEQKTITELWNELVTPVDQLPDISMLGSALKVYCARISPDWDILQLDPRISSVLNTCFELLDKVYTEEDAKLWLDSCKAILSVKIEKVTQADSIK